MGDAGNPSGRHAADDALPIAARELCHDLLESAATIGLLAQAADLEAGPAVAPESQLQGRLRIITAAAEQIATICAQALDQLILSAAPVIERYATPA